MSKKVSDILDNWDFYLKQVLAAIRFSINGSTRFSPFYLLYNHDQVLPIDNILKPGRRYLGEEPHRIGLEQLYKSFVMVHQHLKKAKRRQVRYVDQNSTQNFKYMTLSILNNSGAKVSYKVGGVLIIK